MSELTRKEKERAQHRRLLLEAAEAVFAEKGFHNATVHEIAERAEFSVGYLYNLFEHKLDLHAELIDMRAAEFIADVEERMRRQEDIQGKIGAAVTAKVDFFKAHQRFFLIFGHLSGDEPPGGPAGLPAKARRRYMDYLKRVGELFAEGIAQGLFVDVEPMVLVQCMEGMTNSAIARWIYTGAEQDAMASPEALERILLRGILAEGVES